MKMTEWYEGCTFVSIEIENQQQIVNDLYKQIRMARDYSTEKKVANKNYGKESELLSYMKKNPLSINDQLYTEGEINEQKQKVNDCYQSYRSQSNNINDKALKAEENWKQAKAKYEHMELFNEVLSIAKALQEKALQQKLIQNKKASERQVEAKPFNSGGAQEKNQQESIQPTNWNEYVEYRQASERQVETKPFNSGGAQEKNQQELIQPIDWWNDVEDKQTNKSQSNSEKEAVPFEAYSPTLEVQPKEKLNELDKKITASMNSVIDELETLDKQLTELKLNVENATTSLDRVEQDIKVLTTKEDSHNKNLEKKENALNKINNSFVKRLINFFTGQKTKLTNGIKQLRIDLDTNKQSQELRTKEANDLTKNLESYKDKSVKLTQDIKKNVQKLTDMKKETIDFEVGLSKPVDSVVSLGLKGLMQVLDNNIVVAKFILGLAEGTEKGLEVKRDKIEKKEIKTLTSAASKKSQNLILEKNPLSPDQQVSRA